MNIDELSSNFFFIGTLWELHGLTCTTKILSHFQLLSSTCSDAFFCLAIVTTEPSDEGDLSLGFIQLRTHQHLQRNTTNAWYETSNHLTSTCDTNDQAKQCNSTRHVIKQCKSTRHVIRLISGGIETKPSQSTAPFLSGLVKKLVDVSDDPRVRECHWLHQRLSLAVVRGNTATILACVQA